MIKSIKQKEAELCLSVHLYSEAYPRNQLIDILGFVESLRRSSLASWRVNFIVSQLEFWAGTLLNERPGATEREAKKIREKASAAIACIKRLQKNRGTANAMRHAAALEKHLKSLGGWFAFPDESLEHPPERLDHRRLDQIKWRTLDDAIFIIEHECREIEEEFTNRETEEGLKLHGLQVRKRKESSAKRGRHEHVWLTGMLELWENLGFSRSERKHFTEFCELCFPPVGAVRPVLNAGPIRKSLAPINETRINTFFRKLAEVRQHDERNP